MVGQVPTVLRLSLHPFPLSFTRPRVWHILHACEVSRSRREEPAICRGLGMAGSFPLPLRSPGAIPPAPCPLPPAFFRSELLTSGRLPLSSTLLPRLQSLRQTADSATHSRLLANARSPTTSLPDRRFTNGQALSPNLRRNCRDPPAQGQLLPPGMDRPASGKSGGGHRERGHFVPHSRGILGFGSMSTRAARRDHVTLAEAEWGIRPPAAP
jgi:hypothetical protein